MTPRAWRRWDTLGSASYILTNMQKSPSHPQLEKALTDKTFEAWTRSDVFVESEVKVSLPRFSLAETYKLKEILISLGMKDAFNVEMSDFTGEADATAHPLTHLSSNQNTTASPWQHSNTPLFEKLQPNFYLTFFFTIVYYTFITPIPSLNC